MPIIDLQQRQRELGRIRIGQKATGSNGKERPAKLDKFRFTSASEPLISAIAALYGGEVLPWENDGLSQFEVFTQASRVPILLPPQPISQWYELWSGGGCQRRCDGRTNVLKDSPCVCPSDPLERATLAAQGRACKPTTRLNVLLRDVPGIGVWRLESHGFHSAVELPMVAEFLARATEAGTYLPADLALVRRSSKTPGVGKREWMVPVIEVGATPRELMSGQYESVAGSGSAGALGASRRAIEAAKPKGEAHWKAQANAAGDFKALTEALSGAQAEGLAREGDELFAHFIARRAQIQNPQQADEDEITDAEIVDPGEYVPGELDGLWALIVENAGDWNSATLEREFARYFGGTHPSTATAEQMREFLARLQQQSGAAA